MDLEVSLVSPGKVRVAVYRAHQWWLAYQSWWGDKCSVILHFLDQVVLGGLASAVCESHPRHMSGWQANVQYWGHLRAINPSSL